MADEKLAASLQQAVLTALCFDAPYGALIASQVKPDYFDGVYRDFVTRVLDYRRRFSKPPKQLIRDLADQSSFGKDNTVVQKRLVPRIIEESDGLNAEYVATRVQDFVERQVFKAALIEGGDRYGTDDEALVTDLRQIFHKALQFRQNTMDAGTFLDDPRGLSSLGQQTNLIASLGIPELDKHRIGLIRKQLLLYLAPKGSGKSWFCVHCGKQALLQRHKVVHYSLEMDETEVIPRYYQSLFELALDPERYNETTLEFDTLGRLSGFKTKSVRPTMDLTKPNVKGFIKRKMGIFGTRFHNLVVKDFPTSVLTIPQLVGHLDYLQEVEDFIPDLMIVDYPKLMHMGRGDSIRLELGRTVEELRGIAATRNMALVAPHQGTRSTIGAKRVRSKDAGEDISVIQTADTILAFSRTEAEERRGLGRLSVEHTRKARSKQLILLTQSYETGQYVLNSAPMQKAYWDRLRDMGDLDEDEEEE